MATTVPTGLPGLSTLRTATARNPIKAREMFLTAGKVIAGASARDPGNTGNIDVLRAGTLMGKITSGGKYAPSVLGVTTGAYASGGTSLSASAATVTELLRRQGASGTFKLTGPPSANGVVATATVTYSAASGTTITIVSPGANFVAGSFIQPTDGSETPLTFVWTPNGIKVTDEAGSDADVPFAEVPIEGEVDSSQLLPWPSDTSLRAWIWARLNSVDTGKFVPNHLY